MSHARSFDLLPANDWLHGAYSIAHPPAGEEFGFGCAECKREKEEKELAAIAAAETEAKNKAPAPIENMNV